MRAPLNLYELQTLRSFIVFRFRSGFPALRSWKSDVQSSASSEHRTTAGNSSCLELFEADLALCLLLLLQRR